MYILTHPKNKPLIESITVKASNHLERQGIANCRIDGIPIIFTDDIPAEKWYGRYKRVDKCKFISYDLENPSDWEIYFGFVEKMMEPNFIFYDPKVAFVSDKDGQHKRYEYGKILRQKR